MVLVEPDARSAAFSGAFGSIGSWVSLRARSGKMPQLVLFGSQGWQ